MISAPVINLTIISQEDDITILKIEDSIAIVE